MLTLRSCKIGPPVYAHLADYDVREDVQSIGRIMEQREPVVGNEWFWGLQIVGAHRAGVATSRYAARRSPREKLFEWRVVRIKSSPAAIIGYFKAANADHAVKAAIAEREINDPLVQAWC